MLASQLLNQNNVRLAVRIFERGLSGINILQNNIPSHRSDAELTLIKLPKRNRLFNEYNRCGYDKETGRIYVHSIDPTESDNNRTIMKKLPKYELTNYRLHDFIFPTGIEPYDTHKSWNSFLKKNFANNMSDFNHFIRVSDHNTRKANISDTTSKYYAYTKYFNKLDNHIYELFQIISKKSTELLPSTNIEPTKSRLEEDEISETVEHFEWNRVSYGLSNLILQTGNYKQLKKSEVIHYDYSTWCASLLYQTNMKLNDMIRLDIGGHTVRNCFCWFGLTTFGLTAFANEYCVYFYHPSTDSIYALSNDEEYGLKWMKTHYRLIDFVNGYSWNKQFNMAQYAELKSTLFDQFDIDLDRCEYLDNRTNSIRFEKIKSYQEYFFDTVNEQVLQWNWIDKKWIITNYQLEHFINLN